MAEGSRLSSSIGQIGCWKIQICLYTDLSTSKHLVLKVLIRDLVGLLNPKVVA